MGCGDLCYRPPNMKINLVLILLAHSQTQQNQREQAGSPQITQGGIVLQQAVVGGRAKGIFHRHRRGVYRSHSETCALYRGMGR